MSYELLIERAAERDLRALERSARDGIIERLISLAEHPCGPNTKALGGPLTGLRRLRIGDWRVCYQVDEDAETVTIIEIGHRRDIYQRLLRRLRGR